MELEKEFEALLIKSKNTKLIESYSKFKTEMVAAMNNAVKAIDVQEAEITKLKNEKSVLPLGDVRLNEVAICDCYKNEKDNMISGVYCKKHKTFFPHIEA